MFGDYYDGYFDGVEESNTTGGGVPGLRERTTMISPLTKVIVSKHAEDFFKKFYTKYDACETSAEKAMFVLRTKVVVGLIATVWGFISMIPLGLAGFIVLSPIGLLALLSNFIGPVLIVLLPVLLIFALTEVLPWGLTVQFRFILLPLCLLTGWFDSDMPRGEYTDRYLDYRVDKEFDLNHDQGIEGTMNMIQKVLEKRI